jgi:hypothetical protein
VHLGAIRAVERRPAERTEDACGVAQVRRNTTAPAWLQALEFELQGDDGACAVEVVVWEWLPLKRDRVLGYVQIPAETLLADAAADAGSAAAAAERRALELLDASNSMHSFNGGSTNGAEQLVRSSSQVLGRTGSQVVSTLDTLYAGAQARAPSLRAALLSASECQTKIVLSRPAVWHSLRAPAGIVTSS